MTVDQAIYILRNTAWLGSNKDRERTEEAVEMAVGALNKAHELPSAQPDLDEWCTDCKEYDHDRHCCPRWNRVIRETLKDAQSEQRWIPCEKELPEEYGEYRITWTTSVSKRRLIGDAEYEVTGVWDADHDRFEGEWLLDEYIKSYPNVKVLAWKPLEEPYRGGEEVDTDEKKEGNNKNH